MKIGKIIACFLSIVVMMSCKSEKKKEEESKTQIKKEVTAKDILGNQDYMAISYGG